MNALPGDESDNHHQGEDAKGHDSDQGTAAQDTDATPAGSQQGAAAALESPTAYACLQMLSKFKDHDPGLFSDLSRRWTTNGLSLYDFIRDAELALCCSLERKLNRPGTEAFKALSSFVDTVWSACMSLKITRQPARRFRQECTLERALLLSTWVTLCALLFAVGTASRRSFKMWN